jgi:DNA-binding transcriptional LysR family regulator
MELYQLRSLVAIAEAGQLTRAAEKLHISQPALSAQLRALEEELEIPLFDRTSTGMRLTPGGKKILRVANKVLAAAAQLHNEARLVKGKVAGSASIGTLSDPDFVRLGEFMSEAVARYPLLQIELHQEVTGAAMERVAAGELDASYYYGEVKNPDVAGLPLRDMVYRIAGPASWRERLENADWHEIAAMPWIIPPPISSHHKLAHALLHEHGVDATNVVEADQEAVVTSLVVSGLGIALMREDAALEKLVAGEICMRNDVRISTTLWFIYQRERRNDPVIRALLSVQEKMWDMQRENPDPKATAAVAMAD